MQTSPDRCFRAISEALRGRAHRNFRPKVCRTGAANCRGWGQELVFPLPNPNGQTDAGDHWAIPRRCINGSSAKSRCHATRRCRGKKPVEEKRAAAKAPGSAGTFGTLAKRYLDEYSRRRKRSSEGDERNLRKHILPKWAGRGFSEIRRRDVIELVEALVTAGTPTLANRVQSLISSVFTFAMDADLAEANPCHRLRKRGVERVGRRVLSDEEIGLFWSKIVEPPAIRRTGLALRLTLLTGARISEIAGISRAELERLGDASRAAWIIPGTRTKNGRDHLVPLSPLAQDLVLELLESLGQSDEFLLSTYNRDRKGPVSGKSLSAGNEELRPAAGRRHAGGQNLARRTAYSS